MNEPPETRYVAVGEADVAYQVIGDGPRDLLYTFGLGSHVEAWRDLPVGAEFLRRLASFSRVIVFDRRGTGASDGVPRNAIPTWEEWTEDLGAVLDAAGSTEAAILAFMDAGAISILFAAMHPERVRALILFNTSARFLVADDYPIGASVETADAFVDVVREQWGTAAFARLSVPSIADDHEQVALSARASRMAATPRTAAAQVKYILQTLDVRDALSLVQVPTLVLHTCDNPFVPVAHGRYLAEHIPGARFVELPGGDLGVVGLTSEVADEVAEFLTGNRPAIEIDRVLSTVLFTDIVASTEQLSARGDDAWRKVLDNHEHMTSRVVAEYGGTVVKTTGDGILATFDGPARAVRCASALLEAAHGQGITLRAGLHTGEIELRPSDVAGIAVHIASRISTLAGPGEVLVSRTVVDLTAGSGLQFEPRDEHELKGVPGTWETFAAHDSHAP
jgi:class 3 adenylate cyclase/alpha-beta hydrolase superfamily lysophospholipase